MQEIQVHAGSRGAVGRWNHMKDLKLKAITALRALGNYLLVRRAILLIAEREQVHNERKLDSLSELNDLLEAGGISTFKTE